MRDRRRGAYDESGRVCKGLDDERSLVLNAKRKGTQVGVDRVALDGNDLPGRRCGGGRGRVEGGDREGASDGVMIRRVGLMSALLLFPGLIPLCESSIHACDSEHLLTR